MIVYWLFFFLASAIALGQIRPVLIDDAGRRPISAGWVFMIFVLIVLIGLRFEVGGDWFTYLEHLERARYYAFNEVFLRGDPSYAFLNFMSARMGFGVTGVNTACAVIFSIGLVVFLHTLPRPWLGLACAVPYLIIVVAMGYTRQSAALGFVLLGMCAVSRGELKKFILWVCVAATFHKTAVVLLPLAAFISTKGNIQKLGLVGLVGFGGFDLLLADHTDRLVDTYVVRQVVSSDGALIRLVMNAIPATAIILLGPRLNLNETERGFWKVCSWIAVGMLIALFGTGLSTALDRMALYFVPLQLLFFTHLPDSLNMARKNTVFGIIAYYTLVQFTWLFFASHARYWLPYQIGFQ